MQAVGYWKTGVPIADPAALEDLEVPAPPAPQGRDLLVRVHGIAVNPRDIKSRMSLAPEGDGPRILGYDAAGVVEAAGPEATLFRPGDAVFYAGVLDRPGSNAELQLVDERIVGRKPESLDPAAAAALPLTSLTAWEMLFDRLALPEGGGAGEALLVIGGAGGVPSMALQLARALSRVEVVGTASRPESAEWVREMGAAHVVDHSQPLAAQVAALEGLAPVTRLFSTHTDAASWAQMAEIVAPQGRVGLIDDPEPLDLRLFKFKSVSIHWEAMFTRPMFATADMDRQHQILTRVAELVDDGRLRAPVGQHFGTICAENLRRAHAALEGGHVTGKIVLSGYGAGA